MVAYLLDGKSCLQTGITLKCVKKNYFLRKWQTSQVNNYKVTNSLNEKFADALYACKRIFIDSFTISMNIDLI